MKYVCEGPFINPHWANPTLTDKERRLHDQYVYVINGHSFSHPTYEGAAKMMQQPERHREVIEYFPPNWPPKKT